MNIITKRAAINVTAGVMGCAILPQNGVVDGSMIFCSGGSSPQIDRAPTITSHNGNVSSNNTQKQRPTALGVNSKNMYATKTLQEDSNDIDAGSLPNTPELQSDSELDVSGCSAVDEVLENDTRQLVKLFLREFTGLSKPRWNNRKALSTMKRVVDDVLEKHRYAYNGRFRFICVDCMKEDSC